jgi:hypothetical protein
MHETPTLLVFTATLWALCVRAADRLAARLHSGEEL